MHGEYKIPGGKLVVADLEVINGQLRHVVLSGDFFLEPDSTLDRITAAVEGTATSLPLDELTERVRAATEGAELLGISPAGVVEAVRRAIAGAQQ